MTGMGNSIVFSMVALLIIAFSIQLENRKKHKVRERIAPFEKFRKNDSPQMKEKQ